MRYGKAVGAARALAQSQLQHCTEAPRAFGDDVLWYRLASQTIPSLPLQHAGGLAATLSLALEPDNPPFETQTDERFAPWLHIAKLLSDC
jgi:hypothetical protein